jgi:molybdate transport system ATP-binding protein
VDTLKSAQAPISVAPQPSSLSVRLEKRLSDESSRGFLLDVDLILPPGITILFGPSGSGKTTLLRCISGLLRPDSGRIALGERVVFDSARRIDESVSRRSIAHLFQDLALFPHLTVEGNVEYGLSKLAPVERSARAREILESFRVSHLVRRRPGEISGGERQRVALARALVTRPRALLLDEPLSALDAPTKSRIIDDLRVWNQIRRVPIVYVTHSQSEVFALGEQVIVLEEGRAVSRGTPQEVLEAPRREMLARLVGFENVFDAVVTALDERSGTMTCRLAASSVALEVPLARVLTGASVRLAVRANDILLGGVPPARLSARNVIEGRVTSVSQTGVSVHVRVNCGVDMEVVVTPGARDALELGVGKQTWLIIKTHSCHLVRPEGS